MDSKPFAKLASGVVKQLYDLSGARYLVELIKPLSPKEAESIRPPSTFIFWLLSTHVAIYYFALSVYQQDESNYNEKLSVVLSGVSNPQTVTLSLNRIVDLQKESRIESPHSYNIFHNLQVVSGLKLSPDEFDVKYLRKLLESYKTQFNSTFFVGIDLSNSETYGLDLRESNFELSNLTEANLSNSDFQGSSFNYAKLIKTDLRNSDLTGSRFHMAELRGVKFFTKKGNVEVYDSSLVPELFLSACYIERGILPLWIEEEIDKLNHQVFIEGRGAC